jgi:HSP20 family molecular chaperone IbpA
MKRYYLDLINQVKEIEQAMLDNMFPLAQRNAYQINYFMYNKDNTYFIEFKIPGITEKEIEVTANEETLNVKIKDETFSFYIPSDGNSEKIEATLKYGILTIAIPKKDEIKRKIEIKVDEPKKIEEPTKE